MYLGAPQVKNEESAVFSSGIRKDRGNCLLIIDPQNDYLEDGKCPLPGAKECSRIISDLIDSVDFSDIYISFNSRAKYQISHPTFWENGDGEHPIPLTTVITRGDVEDDMWNPVRQEHKRAASSYISSIARGTRYGVEATELLVWPEHCLIGSHGHAVIQEVFDAVDRWEERVNKVAQNLQKGSHSLTEQYSIFRSESKVSSNPDISKTNATLVKELSRYKRVIVCGMSASHAVNYSLADYLNASPKSRAESVWLVQDALCSLEQFHDMQEEFLQRMTQSNVQIKAHGEIMDLFKPTPAGTVPVGDQTFGAGAYLFFKRNGNLLYYEFLTHPPDDLLENTATRFLAYFTTSNVDRPLMYDRHYDLSVGAVPSSESFFKGAWKFLKEAADMRGLVKFNQNEDMFHVYGYIRYQNSISHIKTGTGATEDDEIDLALYSKLAVVSPTTKPFQGLKKISESFFMESVRKNRKGYAYSLV